LNRAKAELLLRKYLSEYRKENTDSNTLSPFTEEAVSLMGEQSEYNATNLLKMAYTLLDKAAEISNQTVIDKEFFLDNKQNQEAATDRGIPTIENAESTDLIQKAKSQE